MKVKVKTISQKTFDVEVTAGETVETIKTNIMKSQDNDPNLAPDLAKLIWKGKILKNDATVESAGINDQGFFVVMPGKAKVAAAPAVQTVSKPVEKPVEQKKEEPKEQPVTQSAPAASQPVNSGIAISDELLATIVGLGIDREKAVQALQIARGNPDVAVDLIMSGNLEQVMQQAQAQAAAPQASSAPPAGSNPLAALTANPNFQAMLTAVRENPEILPQMMQQIQQTNPQLLNLIQENHEAFLQMMNEDSPLPPAAGAPAAQAPQQGNQISIQVTPEERDAIQRLMGLGVSELEAAQAYMACDKNEEAAANFLLDQN